MAVQKNLTYLLLLAGGCLAALALGWALLQSDEPLSSAVEEAAISIENASAPQQTITKSATGNQNQQADTAPTSAQKTEADVLGDTTQDSQIQGNADVAFSLSLARITPDGYAVFAGTGMPDTIIELLEENQLLASTKTTSDGDWVAIPDQPLAPGTHLIIARMIKSDGSIELADMSVVVEIQADEADTPLVALVPQDESGTAQLLQMPKQAPEIADISSKENAAQQADQPRVLAPALRILTLTWKGEGRLQVAGDMQAGRQIEAEFASKPVASLSFKDTSRPVSYAFVIDAAPLDKGPQNLALRLFDEAGQQVTSTSLMLSSEQLQSGLNGNQMVVIQKGDMLWRIAYRTYGSGVRYVDIVSRNQTQIADPDLIYPNQIFALPQN